MDILEKVRNALDAARSARTADQLITVLAPWVATGSVATRNAVSFAGTAADLLDALGDEHWKVFDNGPDASWAARSLVDGSRVEYAGGTVYTLI